MKAKNVELVCKLQTMRPLVDEVSLLGDAAVKLVRSDPSVLRHTLQALTLAAEKLLSTSRECQCLASDLVRINDKPALMTTAELKKEMTHA